MQPPNKKLTPAEEKLEELLVRRFSGEDVHNEIVELNKEIDQAKQNLDKVKKEAGKKQMHSKIGKMVPTEVSNAELPECLRNLGQ